MRARSHSRFKTTALTALFLVLQQIAFLSNSNAQLVSYQTPLTALNLTPNSIDLNRPVGTLAGSMGVSATGAATYSIPINVVPGTMGVEPKLSLEYNSQSGNGQMGWGWSLSGMSAISRVGSDNYHDGKVVPIEWNGNDFYSLDGSRLTLLSGGGNIGSVFGTESESWSKIESWGWLGSGPEYFTVWMKDGSICEYGHEPLPNQLNNSKVMNNAGTEVLAWKINRIRDVNGNYMSFHYTNDGGDHRIAGIWYTGSTTLNKLPYQHVGFNYTERSDPNTVYEGGSAYNSKYLLTSVVCYPVSTSAVRTYSLGYKFTDGYSFLQTVQECGTMGSCFNESQFVYGSAVNEVTSTEKPELQWINTPVDGGHEIQAGDFNGDGISDVVRYEKKLVDGWPVFTNIKVSISSGGANPSFEDIYSCPFSANIISNSSSVPNGYNFHPADYDGDGTDDLLIIALDRTNYPHSTITDIKLITKIGRGSAVITPCVIPPQPNLNSEHTVLTGDFDGDGRMEFIISFINVVPTYNNGTISYSSRTARSYLSSPGKGYVNEEVSFPSSSTPHVGFAQNYFISVIDFEGDGKSEVMAVNKDYNGSFDSKTKIFAVNRTNQNTWDAEIRFEAGYPTCGHSILLGDFNGDRKTDLLTRTNNANRTWQIAFSTGQNFSVSNLNLSFNPTYSESPNWTEDLGTDDRIMLSDFDGDGKTDIYTITRKNISSPSTTQRIYRRHHSRGNNIWASVPEYTEDRRFRASFLTADFSGDGKSDVIYHGPYYDFINFRENSEDKFLNKVRNGIGLISSLTYGNIVEQDADFYTFSGLTSYPFNTISVPYYAVHGTWENWPGNYSPQNIKNYSYKNLRFHKGGKGVLGFEQTEVKDVNANIKTTEKVLEWNTTYYIPKTTESSNTSTVINRHTPISKTTNYFVTTPISSTRFIHQLDWAKSEDLLQGTYTAKSFQYDNWGNPRKISSEVNGWLEESMEEITYAPTSTTATHVPSKPETITKTLKRVDPFATPVTLRTKFSYTNGRLNQKRVYDNLAIPIVTTYGYNTVGLPTTTTTTAGSLSRTSSITAYDALYRAPLTIVDALGQTATATYDYRWGVPLTQTGIDNLTTSYTYDNYGRLATTTIASSWPIITTEEYAWESTMNPILRYSHTTTQTGQGTAKTGYDVKGREVETRKSMWGTGTSALWSTATKSYNSKGQLYSETAPKFPSEPSLTSTYSYDYLNRLETVTTPTNTLTYSYNYGVGATGKNLRVDIEDATGHKTSKETDPAGKVVESNTEGGKLQYNYDSWGNVVRTLVGSSPSYNTFTTYDAYNRRYTATESSAGGMRYGYNGFGELITEKDALNNTSTTGYDVLGRVNQRTGPEGTTTYQYGLAGTGSAGKLKKVIGFAPGAQTENTYDQWGFLTSVAETMNGQVYTTSYDYDMEGRPSSTTYPNNGPLISNLYNEHGLLTTVIKGGFGYGPQDILYEVQSINGRGQTRTATRANGLTTTNTYEYDALKSTNTPGTGSTKVQDYSLEYEWNKGLIKTRQENALNNNVAEAFTYDDAGRLKGLSFINPANPTAIVPFLQAINYGTGGAADNIILKADVGQFEYGVGNGKMHTLGYTSNALGQIPTQTQEVSYTPFHRPNVLKEANWEMRFQYGPDYERRRTDLYNSGMLEETRHYFGSGSERHEDLVNGTTRDLFYIPGPDGVAAIIKIENGDEQVFYPYSDHLGSITALTDINGTVVCRQAFDPWGRRRNPADLATDDNALPADYAWLRGFTGHEHLPQFKLINMNARLYDPLLGRMLSPDNYVTDASNPMTYNLYSYANNNPISYVDPSGNFVGAAFTALAFLGESASNLVSGVSNPFGTAYNKAQSATQEVGTAFQYTIAQSSNSSFTVGIDPFSFGLTANYARKDGDGSITSNIGIGINPLGVSANAGVNFNTGNWNWGGSFGTNFNTYSIGGGITFNDGHTTLGYYQTYYGGSSENQWNGGIIAGVGDFNFRLENDFLMVGHHRKQDRWRTQALEIGIGNMTFGSFIHTGDPGNSPTASGGITDEPSRIWGPNRGKGGYQSWGPEGIVKWAPAYIGVRYGNMTSRTGYSAKVFQDFQQNGIHQSAFKPGNQHYYLNYSNFKAGGYFHGGFYNNHSLYGY